jgi:hypothetical protein
MRDARPIMPPASGPNGFDAGPMSLHAALIALTSRRCQISRRAFAAVLPCRFFHHLCFIRRPPLSAHNFRYYYSYFTADSLFEREHGRTLCRATAAITRHRLRYASIELPMNATLRRRRAARHAATPRRRALPADATRLTRNTLAYCMLRRATASRLPSARSSRSLLMGPSQLIFANYAYSSTPLPHHSM